MRARNVAIWFFALGTLTACGGGGGGGGGTTPQPTNTIPSAPTITSITGGHRSLDVTWTISPNATSYNLYWAESSGVTPQTGNKITPQGGPPETILGLVNGRTYAVVVTAANSFGESAASAELQGRPVATLPARATGVVATAGAAQITVAWDLQPDADDYSISLTSNGYGGVELDQILASPFVVDGLTNSVTYSVTVAANNSVGQGGPSNPTDATPIAPVPGWTPETQINEPPRGLESGVILQDLDINENGVAAALWTSFNGYPSTIRRLAVNHTTGGTWGEQFFLDFSGSSAAVAITPNGDIHVAYDVGRKDIWWRRFRDGGWSDPVKIQSNDAKVGHLFAELAADNQGNVFAAWSEVIRVVVDNEIGEAQQLWVRRFDAVADDWDDAVMVSESVRGIFPVAIEAGASNLAVVTWLQDTQAWDPSVIGGVPPQTVVYASLFDGSNWQPGEIVGRNDLVDDDRTREFALDVNDSGSAVVVWNHFLSSPGSADSYQVGAARYDAQLGQWSTPETIQEGTIRPIIPDAAIDLTGKIIAAWHNGLNSYIGSSAYDTVAALWGAITPLPTDTIRTGNEFNLEVDGTGAHVLAWTVGGDPRGVFVRRLEPSATVWSDSDHLGGGANGGVRMHMKTNRSGHTIIMFNGTVILNNTFQRVVFAIVYTP